MAFVIMLFHRLLAIRIQQEPMDAYWFFFDTIKACDSELIQVKRGFFLHDEN